MLPTNSSSYSPNVVCAGVERSRWTPFKTLRLIFFCAVFSGSGLPVIGQVAPNATVAAAPTHHTVTAATPQRIVERELNGCVASGADYSIVWTFQGLKGQGKFDGTVQGMDIDSFDGHTLVVRRTSYAGGQIGSGQINGTAIYTGQINGTHITGTAKYYPTGRNASEGPWCGEIEDPKVLMPEILAARQAPADTPPQILECELNQYCDGLWSVSGASGKAVWPRNPNVLADLTVESFSPDKIVIRRTDTTPNGFSVVYTGRLDGNRITGTALAQAGAKSFTYNWTAIIPATSCVRTDGLKPDTQEALDVGNIALRFNLEPAALDCYLIAAKNGDAVAQNTVAILLYEGGKSPIKQDYSQSFYWVSRSAAQGNYFAEQALANMYKEGKGTGIDPVKAQYWFEQAAATPEAREIAQDKARAAQEQMMFNLFFGAVSAVMSDSGSSGNNTTPANCSAYSAYQASLGEHTLANYRSPASMCGH
jgi:hypothetical protein